MDKKVVDRVIEKLSQKMKPSGSFVQFNDPSYKAARLDKSNFRQIKGVCAGKRIVFIDGGNNTVFDAASFCLQLIRTYCTIYCGNKREKSFKKEFLLLVSSSSEKGKDAFEAEAFGADERFTRFNAFDSTIAMAGYRAKPADVASACRKLSELREAIIAVDGLEKGDIIVLDRDLQASVTGEKELLDALYSKAEQKNVVICAISKTTRLFTDTGDSAASFLSSIAPETDWWYWPVAEISNEKHRAEICFVKLNKASKYIFRLEVYKKQKAEIENALCSLKKNSTDPVFIGYPYGLIEADKFARVSHDEAEYLKVMLAAKAGNASKMITKYMKSVDAHSVLDNIS